MRASGATYLKLRNICAQSTLAPLGHGADIYFLDELDIILASFYSSMRAARAGVGLEEARRADGTSLDSRGFDIGALAEEATYGEPPLYCSYSFADAATFFYHSAQHVALIPRQLYTPASSAPRRRLAPPTDSCTAHFFFIYSRRHAAPL